MINLLAILNTIPPDHIWGAADIHAYHKGIIAHESRPYDSLESMHDDYIYKHNQKVKPDDVVIFCGDLSFGGFERTREFVSRLNGRIILTRGNHDRLTQEQYLAFGVICVPHLCYRDYGFLHVPPQSAEQLQQDMNFRPGPSATHLKDMSDAGKEFLSSPYITKVVYGHLHRVPFECDPAFMDKAYCNVGIDLTGYAPVRLSELTLYKGGLHAIHNP